MIANQPARPFGHPLRLAGIAANIILAVFLLTGTTRQLHAADITWIGGDANWDSSNARWNPADEPDADDTAIFNTANSVSLALDNAILALTLSGGISLNTSGNNLDVDGHVQLSGASTILIVGGSNSVLSADRITLNNGSTLRLTNGVVTINEESGTGLLDLNAGGTLTGNGMVSVTDAVAANTILLLNDGTITAVSTTPGDLLGLSGATLTIGFTDPDARIDLDGSAEAGTVNVGVNDTLEINGPLADIFNGTINLNMGSTLRLNFAWVEGSGAMIHVNTASIISGNPGPAATIAGAPFSMNAGTIDLDDADSLRFSAPFAMNGGTISNEGHVIFNANSAIAADANFLMVGAVASLTVDTNVIVNIDDPDFNLDGTGTASNIVTIHSGGVLDLDLGAGADEALTGTIHLNGGELDVTTLDNNWSIDGIVNVGANTGVSQINGDEVTITSATLTVGTNSTLDLNASSVWAAPGQLIVQSGGVARLDGLSAIVQPGANFSGDGVLINGPIRTLRLLDGVASSNLNVLVRNEGVLQLGVANSDAQVGGKDFQQTASGTLQIDIGGTALNAFDRFNLTGAAALSGALNLSFINGFVPSLGQTFNILTASGGVSGQFTTVSQPFGMPAGTVLSVSYSPLAVQLIVTTPYEAWINSFPSLTVPADKSKTADPDHDGKNNLVEFALDGNPTNALAAGKVMVKVAPVGGVNALTLTFPVRAGATLDPADPPGGPLVLKQIGDAVSYRIEASEGLTISGWTLNVTEVVGADANSIQAGLPALNAGWVYRTFRSPGAVAGDPEEYMQLVIGD